MVNAGLEGAVIVQEVKKNKKASCGFNAASKEYGDVIEAGIDPTKVTRTALQLAASSAGLMITTECVVTELPEDEKKMPGGMGGGDVYESERAQSAHGRRAPASAHPSLEGRGEGEGGPRGSGGGTAPLAGSTNGAGSRRRGPALSFSGISHVISSWSWSCFGGRLA